MNFTGVGIALFTEIADDVRFDDCAQKIHNVCLFLCKRDRVGMRRSDLTQPGFGIAVQAVFQVHIPFRLFDTQILQLFFHL